MKKKIIRLTESDLHQIVENAVNSIISELREPSRDYVNDVLNADYVGKCTISFVNSTYGEGDVEVVGKSGTEYTIKVFVNGEYIKGEKSHDYDVPDDYDETNEWISDIELYYYDDEANYMVGLPLDSVSIDELKKFAMSRIEFDWSNYDPYDDYYE